MRTDTPVAIHLKDYRAPDWIVEHLELEFDLDPARTVVTAEMVLSVTHDGAELAPVRLDGEDLELLSLELDGVPLDPGQYLLSGEGLEFTPPARRFQLRSRVCIAPEANTKLEGLYRSSGNYCTQCEAEGFRRITFFTDRPDMLTTFRVTIRADRESCPVLLSNGNLVEEGTLPDGRHFALWEDPFPKPSYLFALVAGRLDRLADHFTTASGREVALNIWVEPGNAPKATYAMDALKRSMRWDETRFGLEYDLDIFNIVAVGDFNMGAMENKSLNIFNAKYILADAQTATDGDFAAIESIVGHEYFHNWTGNRITCRDWFQLSLKEGLTVFRDQEFSADMRSRAVQRISEVRTLRGRQFPEDAGPLAHPVRPASYIEINNFYTATVYEKGAEVIRMLHTLLGEDGFMAGMRLYVERHDGQAATCDDFVAAMADATGRDLSHFKLWYAQAGTPKLSLHWKPSEGTGGMALTIRQRTAPTPGQPEKAALYMPFCVAWIGPDGTALQSRYRGSPAHEHVLHLSDEAETFLFEGVPAGSVPSLNRGFSAPVNLEAQYGPRDRAFLMAHDTDPFARWEAGQQFAAEMILALVNDPRPEAVDPLFLEACGRILNDGGLDPAFRAQALILPALGYLADQMQVVDYDALHAARQAVRIAVAQAHAGSLAALWTGLGSTAPYSPDPEQAGRRALKAVVLGFLGADAASPASAELAKDAYEGADNMTDRMAALSVLVDIPGRQADAALADFHERFKDDPLVLDKWFALQAMAIRPDVLGKVKALMGHPAFSIRNPNKVRALIGSFASGNPVRFHAADGSGYSFLTDQAIAIDPLNPQVAARLLATLGRWKRFDASRQALMRAELNRVLAFPGLSRDCFEIASKSLEK